MLMWRSIVRIGCLIIVVWLNFGMIHPIHAYTATLHAEKLWQYGEGTIQDFDWAAQDLVLVTTNGILQTSPTFNQAPIPLTAKFSRSDNPFVLGKGTTSQIDVSPDGLRFLTKDGDGVWRIRDMQNGDVLAELAIPSSVTHVMWQPDGTTIATKLFTPSDPPAQQNKVALWDTHSGRLKATIGGYGASISAVSWNPAGTMLAVRLDNGIIDIENAVQPQRLHELTSAPSSIAALAWSPDGATLSATGNSTSPVIPWKTDSWERLSTQNPPDFIGAVAWNANSTLLAGSLADGTIALWNINTGTLSRLSAATAVLTISPVIRIVWHDDRLAKLDSNGQIQVWNADNNTLVAESTGFTNGLDSMAVSRTGNLVALNYTNSNEIIVLDGTMGNRVKTLKTIPATTSHITAMAWSDSGERLAVITGKTLFIWQPDVSIAPIQVDNVNTTGYSGAIAWSPDDILAIISPVSGSDDFMDTIQFIDGKTGKSTLTSRQFTGVQSIQWSPDGKYIAIFRTETQNDNTSTPPVQVDLWNLAQNTIATLNFPFSGSSKLVSASFFVWLPDSTGLIGSITQPSLLWTWHVNTDGAIITAALPDNQAFSGMPLQINTQGDKLAMIEDRNIIILDAKNGQQLLQLQDYAALSSVFAWGGADTLFFYDGAVQAFQVR